MCDCVQIPRRQKSRTTLFVCIELDGTLGDIQCEIQGKFKCRSITELTRFSTFLDLLVPNQNFTSDYNQTFGLELEQNYSQPQ